MHLRIYFIVFGAVLLGCSSADEPKGAWQQRDEIYIDDEELEGSGGGKGEVRDDLESSGSGYGAPPDDDDNTDAGSGEDNLSPQQPERTPVEETTIRKTVESGVDAPPPPPPPDTTNTQTHPPPEEPSDSFPSMNRKHDERATSFFAQPGILAAVIGGAVVGLLCAILVVMFIVYRMRKKDEVNP